MPDHTRPDTLTFDKQAQNDAFEAHFKKVPTYTASALEQASKRGCFTLELLAPDLSPCFVTVLSEGPVMMWPLEDSSTYLLMVGHLREMVLKAKLPPHLVANLYRAVRPKYSHLELLGVSYEDGRTTLTLKRGGPAFLYTLEPDEEAVMGFGNSDNVASAYCQVDTVSGDGKVRRRVLDATSVAEDVLEQVWSWMGNGPAPMRPRPARAS